MCVYKQKSVHHGFINELCGPSGVWYDTIFDIHGSVHRRLLNRNTNKMQLCNRIYYSKVYWRLNMFRAAHRSSSGALNCIYSLWFICPCGDRPLPRLSGKYTFHLVKKFPAFYETRKLVTAFTSARHLPLSWASSIQYTIPHPISWRSILTLNTLN